MKVNLLSKIGFVEGVLKGLKLLHPEHEMAIDEAIDKMHDVWQEIIAELDKEGQGNGPNVL